MFGFRTRDPRRDRDTDVARLSSLTDVMNDTLANINAEYAGLEQRYLAVAEQASFLAEALDNDQAAPERWDRVDRLTSSIISYEQRTATLARQLEVLKECRRRISSLVATLDDS